MISSNKRGGQHTHTYTVLYTDTENKCIQRHTRGIRYSGGKREDTNRHQQIIFMFEQIISSNVP